MAGKYSIARTAKYKDSKDSEKYTNEWMNERYVRKCVLIYWSVGSMVFIKIWFSLRIEKACDSNENIYIHNETKEKI